jgi:hypothetical protein
MYQGASAHEERLSGYGRGYGNAFSRLSLVGGEVLNSAADAQTQTREQVEEF